MWRSGLYVANIVVGSIAIAGYWSGGCCGCGYFNYYAGNGYPAGSCGYCTFWNGYQVSLRGREGKRGREERDELKKQKSFEGGAKKTQTKNKFSHTRSLYTSTH